MIDDTWIKIFGGVVGAIVVFFSTVLGIKAAQAETKTNLDNMKTQFSNHIDSINKSIIEHSETLEKQLERQAVSMGREISELKTAISKIKDDFYKPRL